MMADIEAETRSCWQLNVPPLANNKDSCVLTERLPYMWLTNTTGMSHQKVLECLSLLWEFRSDTSPMTLILEFLVRSLQGAE